MVIAEISGNHNGNKTRFLKLVESACMNGADLIKIQTYEPQDITLNNKKKKFKIRDGIWKNYYLWDLYKKACTPFRWHNEAFKIAKKYKKILFSSPFSIRAVDFLEKFNIPLYKIASFEITDYRLINYIASKKKPIIISTGMTSINEVKKAINIIEKYHKKIIIMHCVSNYPTQIRHTNLKRINLLKKEFKNYKIGLSDHTNNIYSAIASITLGVCAIEKHFNIDDKKTPDSEFSINPRMLKELKNTSTEIFESMSSKNKVKKFDNKNLRRSIFASKDIEKDEKLTLKNLVTLRPTIGIGSEKIYEIIGRKIKKKLKKGDPIISRNLKNNDN